MQSNPGHHPKPKTGDAEHPRHGTRTPAHEYAVPPSNIGPYGPKPISWGGAIPGVDTPGYRHVAPTGLNPKTITTPHCNLFIVTHNTFFPSHPAIQPSSHPANKHSALRAHSTPGYRHVAPTGLNPKTITTPHCNLFHRNP
ncbi:MAG: hypothetical protein K9I59_05010 [Chlorobium sp.]|uniref:hypothetical protein n=1 Tax=Chlorobium sp. TaxID=1095 RepID=UPI0025C47091|nr:hypothetical protein [Chlorobium sp.]MCF8271098.1 hypothetical protein [Chlorobium sp.]MCF8287412.1 hypothetical protein [Chlorobium sp.]MCF8291011.1 hypothetical protein [Chlorobium sp.]MCF8385106.1 hypothetical protein [Chlorobium sp.]